MKNKVSEIIEKEIMIRYPQAKNNIAWQDNHLYDEHKMKSEGFLEGALFILNKLNKNEI